MQTIEKTELKIKKLPNATSTPFYATDGSAGMDLSAGIDRPIYIKPFERVAIPIGIIIEVPVGFEAQIRARSGLAIKQGLSLANGIGTIDSDYRGEVKVLMINMGNSTCTINPGDRVAQMVICPVIKAKISVVNELSDTDRSEGGFGSTGIQ